METINISVVLRDNFGEKNLTEVQFEIPETDKVNISEIERQFLSAERSLIRIGISNYLENVSKKKPNANQTKQEEPFLKTK